MTEEDMKIYREIKSRLLERLKSKRIIPDSEIVSIKDVQEASKAMIPYNITLLDEINAEADKINRKNGFYKSNLRKAFANHLFIRNVDVCLDGNGVCNIFVYYWDEDYNNGVVRYSADLYQEPGLEYKVNVAMSEKNEAKISHINFARYFRVAKHFADEFPDVPYVWSKKLDNVYTQRVGDDFIEARVDLNEPGKFGAVLKSTKGIAISREKINNGYLEDDYFGMYNEELAAKTPVNMNDLNPFLQLLTKKYLGLEEDFTRVRQ